MKFGGAYITLLTVMFLSAIAIVRCNGRKKWYCPLCWPDLFASIRNPHARKHKRNRRS